MQVQYDATCMNFESIRLSKVSQNERKTKKKISLIYGISRNKEYNKYPKETETKASLHYEARKQGKNRRDDGVEK